MTDDDAKYAALRAELAEPSPWAFTGAVPPPIEREPEPESPFGVYANENLYTRLTEDEIGDGSDLVFERYEDGYLVTRRESE